MEIRPEPRMLIDGALVASSSGATFPNVNPATEEVIGETADGTLDDAARAVAAARRAFDDTSWSTDAAFRRRCLEQLQAALEEEKETLRATMVAEAGTPVFLTYSAQLDYPVAWLSHWAERATASEYRRELPVSEFLGAPNRGFALKEPVGVVAGITPFNFPLMLTLNKLAPALAAGCTIVLKPSPETPWTTTLLGRIIAEKTDIPPGVVNVVASSSPEVSAALTTDPRVDMISFTGSTAVGRRIMAAASETLKRVHLELGGKSANVILDDADLPVALAMAAAWSCAHAGQGCALYTRLLLPRSRYDEALALTQGMFAGLACGDPTEPTTLHGPLISERQRDRVLGMIEKALADGATLLAGGGRPEHLSKGYYVQPTLLADVDPDSTIAQEEVFGPVLVVIPYDDEDDAVRIANNSIYGLSGSVWSADEERAVAVARRIRAGSVSINNGNWLDVNRPFGGYKQSGIGRENGVEGFEEFLETKVVALPGEAS